MMAVMIILQIQSHIIKPFSAGAGGALSVKGHHGAAEDEPGFMRLRLGHH